MTFQSALNNLVIPAATAGAGALALDVMWGFVPVPVEWKTGPLRHVVKGAGAIVLGQIVGMMFNRRMGDQMAMGALTVTFHSAFRELVEQTMPQIPLGYYSPGAAAGYDPQLGMYVAGSSPQIPSAARASMAEEEMGYFVQEGVGAQY